MTRKLFRKGGPHKIKRVGPHKHSMSICIPTDSDGRVARKCPENSCSPGYFKVKLGTGITGEQEEVFCPYCRRSDQPGTFLSEEQRRYAIDTVSREAQEGIQEVLKDAFDLGPSGRKKIGGGFFSMEWSYKPGSSPRVGPPMEETLQRAVTCASCGLDHSVFGLATWCPDCGADIFLTHVEEEFRVVKDILGDVDRRKTTLGVRVAARDVENALEDTVSMFEAFLKALTRRLLTSNGKNPEEVESVLKKIGNGYQNPARAKKLCKNELEIDLFTGILEEDVKRLCLVFEKRHPITHNLGVVDRKYLEKVSSGELEGREVQVTPQEIHWAIDISLAILRNVHSALDSGD